MKNQSNMEKQLSIVSVPDAVIEWRCSEQMFHMKEYLAFTSLNRLKIKGSYAFLHQCVMSLQRELFSISVSLFVNSLKRLHC